MRPSSSVTASPTTTTLRVSPAQKEELTELVDAKIMEYHRLNRTADGQDIAGDPDSEGDAQTYQLLFALTRTRSRDAASPSGEGS